MHSLQIRHLPDDIYHALVHRADREGRSLAQQAIAELRKIEELDRRNRRLDAIQQMREEIRNGVAPPALRPPEELIRQDRDR